MLIFQMVSWRLEVSGLVPDWSRFSRLYFSNWHPISGSGLGFRTGARLEIEFSVLILYFRTGSGLVRVQVLVGVDADAGCWEGIVDRMMEG